MRKLEISWDQCQPDFQFDGSWRDIYITPASLEDWQAIFPFLRAQSEFKFVTESGPCSVPDQLDATFFADARPRLSFRIAGVLIVFHFFTPDEIECDLDPREVTGHATFEALLGFIRQLGDLTRKRTILTPENTSNYPIISYHPESGVFEYHKI